VTTRHGLVDEETKRDAVAPDLVGALIT